MVSILLSYLLNTRQVDNDNPKFDILAFVVIGVVLARSNNGRGIRIEPKVLTVTIVGAALLSSLIIAGFYLIEG